MSIFKHKTKTPIHIYGVVGTYDSAADAARAIGVSRSVLRRALESGGKAKGHHVRYADMPAECQPFIIWRNAIPVRVDGVDYPNIMAAAGGDRAKWMRIRRGIERAKRVPTAPVEVRP